MITKDLPESGLLGSSSSTALGCFFGDFLGDFLDCFLGDFVGDFVGDFACVSQGSVRLLEVAVFRVVGEGLSASAASSRFASASASSLAK